MNKTVGIINFHCADNVGAVLQAYALQHTVESLGLDVEIIDFKPKYILDQTRSLSNMVPLIKRGRIHSVAKKLFFGLPRYKRERERIKCFNVFRNKHLKLTAQSYLLTSELSEKQFAKEFYITGSDQVWNPHFKKYIGDVYFLSFVSKGKKISYAASIAEDIEDPSLVASYKNLINTFSSISIREKSSLEFVRSMTDKEVTVTLDPTLLLDSEKWSKMSVNPKVKHKYILVYDLQTNRELIRLANLISKKTGYKIVSYSNSKELNNRILNFKYRAPDEFLGLVEQAEFIVTNSFHGTVFSIINKKNFFTIPHTSRGNRMVDLLNDLSLSSRILYQVDNDIRINEEINYEHVDNILNQKRMESIEFLKNAITVE